MTRSVIQIRVSDEEKAAWTEAAAAAGLSLSEWIRSWCNTGRPTAAIEAGVVKALEEERDHLKARVKDLAAQLEHVTLAPVKQRLQEDAGQTTGNRALWKCGCGRRNGMATNACPCGKKR